MPTTNIRLVTPTAVTESGDGTAGWNYVGATAGDFSTFNGGMGDSALAADGDFRATVGTITNDYGFLLGLDSGSASGLYDLEFGVYFNDLGQYKIVENGTPSASVTNTVTPAAGDIVRLNRSGSTVTAEVSKNSGSSWTVVDTIANTSSASLNPFIGVTTNTPAQVLAVVTAASGQTVTSVTGSNITEASSIVFDIAMSGSGDSTHAYLWGGTATSADYTQTLTAAMCSVVTGTGTVTVTGSNVFVPGTATAIRITVPTTTDALDEDGETVTLTLGGTVSNTVTIADDDAEPSITGTTSVTVDAGDPTVITYTLSAVSGRTITRTLTVTDGTATGGGVDYTSTINDGMFATTSGSGTVTISGSTVTIPAGVLVFTLTIPTTA